MDELVAISAELMADSESMATLGAAAVRDARRFDKEHFLARIGEQVLDPAGGRAPMGPF